MNCKCSSFPACWNFYVHSELRFMAGFAMSKAFIVWFLRGKTTVYICVPHLKVFWRSGVILINISVKCVSLEFTTLKSFVRNNKGVHENYDMLLNMWFLNLGDDSNLCNFHYWNIESAFKVRVQSINYVQILIFSFYTNNVRIRCCRSKNNHLQIPRIFWISGKLILIGYWFYSR